MPDEQEPRFVYRIRNWNELYETNRSRRVTDLEWFKARVQIGTEEFSELMAMEDGIAFYGVLFVTLQMAVRGHPRGTLIRFDGTPHTPESIARAVHLPTSVCASAVLALTSIGWLEKISFSRESLKPDTHPNIDRPQTDIVPTSDRLPGDASRRARGVELSREQQQQQQPQQQNARDSKTPAPDLAGYPKTSKEIRKHDPGINGDFCVRLVSACQSRAKADGIPSKLITDKAIARAIEESYQTGPKNHGTGLLINRVPEIIAHWGKEPNVKT